jgi:hypothetical protein
MRILILTLLIGVVSAPAWSQKFKVGKIVDPTTNDTTYTSELIPIGYNHKNHYVGKMYAQAIVFNRKSTFHLGLKLEYPTFQSYPAGMVVTLQLSGDTKLQLVNPNPDLSGSKQGHERLRQPEQIWYSYLEFPLSTEQVQVLEANDLLAVVYSDSVYTVDRKSVNVVSRMVVRVKALMKKNGAQ